MNKNRLVRSGSRGVPLGLLAAAASLAVPLAAGASGLHAPTASERTPGAADAVFVQTNSPSGNQILAYARQANGTLQLAHAYGTGGRGFALMGAVVDKLGSQGSLVYDSAQHLLIAVNAGSDTVTSFSVSGDRLSQRHVVSAGGALPVSLTWHDDLVYVLDAGGVGHVSGFTASDGQLWPIEHSTRPLGLTPGLSPQFLETPGQIGFTPAGNQLVVTTKANGSDIDVLNLGSSGTASGPVVKNPSTTGVPFGFVFDPHGRLLVTEAATSNLSSYAVDYDGTLTHLNTVSDGQAALCWLIPADGFYFGANSASATISAFAADSNATVSLATSNGIVARTAPGPIDMAATADGSYLYVETGGKGIVDEFHVGPGPALTRIGSVDALGSDIEGIVAA